VCKLWRAAFCDDRYWRELFATLWGDFGLLALDVDRGFIQDDWWSVETTYSRLEIRHLLENIHVTVPWHKPSQVPDATENASDPAASSKQTESMRSFFVRAHTTRLLAWGQRVDSEVTERVSLGHRDTRRLNSSSYADLLERNFEEAEEAEGSANEYVQSTCRQGFRLAEPYRCLAGSADSDSASDDGEQPGWALTPVNLDLSSKMGFGQGVRMVAAGDDFACLIDFSGKVFAFGDNSVCLARLPFPLFERAGLSSCAQQSAVRR
jgi:hypothetical protein